MEDFVISDYERFFWDIWSRSPNDPSLLLSYGFLLQGSLKHETLAAALRNYVTEYHPACLNYFCFKAGQLIKHQNPKPAAVLDWISCTDPKRFREALEKPLHLETGPLFRFLISNYSPNSYFFGCAFSHLIFDGLSVEPFIRFITNSYNEIFLNIAAPATLTFPIITEESQNFWREQLKNSQTFPNTHFFQSLSPTEFSAEMGTFHQKSVKIAMPRSPKNFSHEPLITPFHYIAAITAAVLAQYGGDRCTTITLLHTVNVAVEKPRPPGCATNLNLLIVPISGSPSTLCAAVAAARQQARPHQHWPFRNLLQEPAIPHFLPILLNHSPGLINIRPPQFTGLHAEQLWAPVTHGSQALQFTFDAQDNQISLAITASRRRLSAAPFAEFLENWQRMAQFFLHQPEAPLSQFTLSTSHAMLRGPQLPDSISVWERLDNSFKLYASRPALITENGNWCYSEIKQRVLALVQLIACQAPTKTQPMTIGIHLLRSENLLLAILANLFLGSCFVPLDPDYPQERLEFMARSAGVQLILTDRSTMNSSHFCQNCADCTLFVEIPERLESEAIFTHQAPPSLACRPQYLLFTSGSTGEPKGVVISCGNLSSFITAIQSLKICHPHDRLLALTSLNFDIALLELLLPLVSGACVVMAPPQAAANARQIMQLLQSYSITVMQATPSTWRLLRNGGWRNQQPNFRILVGGEPLDESLNAYLISQSSELLQMYGPTETTIWSSCTPLIDSQTCSIGRPIPGTTFYVRGKEGVPCPLGIPGELWIGGSGVCQGYLNGGYAEKFVSQGGETLFKTGDLVCHYGGEDLRFLCRKDQQVKVRGYRIALEEITAQINKVIACEQAITLVRANPDPHLMSFYRTTPGQIAQESPAILEKLRRKLPPYMLPEQVIQLQVFPLTLNQKVDQQLLQTMPLRKLQATFGVVNSTSDITPTCSPIYEKILTLLSTTFDMNLQSADLDLTWGVLGIQSIGLNRLSLAIEPIFQRVVPPPLLYQHTTPRKLGEYLESLDGPSIIADSSHHPPVAPHLSNNTDATVAIIGYSARLPLSLTADAWWGQLLSGHHAIRTATRPSLPGGLQAGFLDDIDQFDASFFQISPIEAMTMDPQQRLLLEESVKTLAHAGYALDGLGHSVGVYIAVTGHDYRMLVRGTLPSSPYAVPGISGSLLANRLSHFFDWQGPSLVVDTACSGSLVACVRAVRDLQAGLIDYALVGAANILLDPFIWKGLQSGNFLSPHFRCATFDATADGYVRGEGVGCLLLRRYPDARREGDPCHGLIIGSAENHGGRAHSLTAPNPKVQTQLLLTAYTNRDIAAQLTAFEAHGTGTQLGDSIEVAALQKAWQEMNLQRSARPIALASVKTQVGHLEPAAGIASLLKMLLSLRHKTLIGNLHFHTLNPYIQLADSPFQIVAENRPWESSGPRIAGISAFGFGGANAHVILQEPPPPEVATAPSLPAVLIVLSAKHPDSLCQMRRDLLAFLTELSEDDPCYCLTQIAYTLQKGRSHLGYRWAEIVESREQLLKALQMPYQPTECPLNATAITLKPPDRGSVNRYRAELDNWLAAYRSGCLPPWEQLYPSLPPNRVSLPTYRFQTQAYWFEQSSQPMTLSTPQCPASQCPAPQCPTPIWQRLSPRRWRCTIPVEHVWLTDHRVNQIPLLPGVAHLCLAWEAYCKTSPERPAPQGFSEIRWLRPLSCSAATLTCDIAIHSEENGYQILSEDDQCASCGQFVVNSAWMPEKAAALPQWQADQSKEAIYANFTRSQLQYGKFFQGILQLWQQPEESCTAYLEPADFQDPLRTNLLDAALQSSMGVLAHSSNRPVLPFSCRSITFSPHYLSMPTGRFFARAQRLSPARVKIAVFQEIGEKILEIDELGIRPMSEKIHYSHELCFTPHWFAVDLQQSAEITPPATIVILYLPASLPWVNHCAEQLPQARLAAYEGPETLDRFPESNTEFWWIDGDSEQALSYEPLYQKAEQFLEAIQLLGQRAAFRLKLISRNGLTLGTHDPSIQPENSLLLGLAQTAAKEYPQGRIDTLITSELTPQHLQRIIEENAQGNPNLEPVLLRDNRRYLRQLRPRDYPNLQATQAAFQPHGTYLIIGGLGGLGMTIADYLARTYQATLILLGRRPAADAELQRLQRAGASVFYESCNLIDEEALHRLFSTYPSIRGIIHSALILNDKSIAFMDNSILHSVLDPKVRGVIALAHVLLSRQLTLDFILFFSSIQTFIANPGQGNYAAACTFKDAMSQFLRSFHQIPTITLNWGYWGTVGVVATPAYQQRMQALGIGSIEPDEGLRIIENTLHSLTPQTAILKATPNAMQRLNITINEGPPSSANPLVPLYNAQDPSILRNEQAHQALEQYSRYQAKQLVLPKNYLPLYRHLVKAIENMPAAEPLPRETLLSQFPEMIPHVRLLDHCLEYYDDLLSGKRDPLSVLFPNGSFERVEPIYRGNPTADYFNQRVADIVDNFQKQRHPTPLQLLEIGAGTGSTTQWILPRLHPDSRYRYTDLSLAFLRKAQEEFLLYSFVEYRRYNVEEAPPADWLGTQDIVIATNVLHATPAISQTLNNVHRLLKPGGLLVINEVTARHDYATLTFGLTAGWWLFKDHHRIPDCPLLSPQTWRELLSQGGFSEVTAHGSVNQQILVACSHLITATPTLASRSLEKSIQDPGFSPPSLHPNGDLTRLLQESIGGVMRIKPEELSPQVPLANYGIDSLIVFELLKPLKAQFGELPATLFFEYPSIAELAEFLATLAPTRQLQQPVDTPTHSSQPTRSRDVAIIGISGRFPGADSCTDLWSLLLAGQHAITTIPKERWDNTDHEPQIYTPYGGFLNQVACFDQGFFNITPRDAEKMDPQERLFLQEAYRTLEDAGYPPNSLKGSEVGVFVGVMNGGYGWLGRDAHQPNDADSLYWSIANRISYTFDWHGPSMAIDTACSSSLTALHLACQALQQGDCTLALVGGVNLILHPQQYLKLCHLHLLSRTENCCAFGAEADGFVDGEGIVAILLKPYETAIRDHDRLYGTIKATALNAGGRSQGYTAPNRQAQQALIQETLRRAGIIPESISYVEAHGTGTALGDPIEIRALTQALAAMKPQSCAIGSLKSNIGHLESAAGLAGAVKVLLQLQKQTLVPTLHAECENPHIDFSQTPFYLQKVTQSWENPAGSPRRALLNSFGAGGANACVLFEETPANQAPLGTPPFIIPFSAKTRTALLRFLMAITSWLDTQGSPDFTALGYTLSVARDHYSHRICWAGNDVDDLKKYLEYRIWQLTAVSPLPPAATEIISLVDNYQKTANSPEKLKKARKIAQCYEAGGVIPWGSIHSRRQVLTLPGYSFDPNYHWINAARHGIPLEARYLEQHVINGQPLLPAAFSLVKILAAVPHANSLSDVSWHHPITSLSGITVDIHHQEFRICTLEGVTCVVGKVDTATPTLDLLPNFNELLQAELLSHHCSGSAFYQALQANGYQYGPLYQRIQKIKWGNHIAWALIDTQVSSDTSIDTAGLDACFQTAMAPQLLHKESSLTYVPYTLKRLIIRRPVTDLLHCIARCEASKLDEFTSHLAIFDSNSGEPAFLIEGLQSKVIGTPIPYQKNEDKKSLTIYRFS